MLKDLSEEGTVQSKLTFEGIKSIEGFSYLGLKRKTTFDEIGRDMEEAIQELCSKVKGNGEPMMALYHKSDLVNNICCYTIALQVDEITAVPEGFVKGCVPKMNTYAIHHRGPYHHIGNAWSSAFSHKGKRYKMNKSFLKWSST